MPSAELTLYSVGMKRRSSRTPNDRGADEGAAGVMVDRHYLELLDEHYRRNWGRPLKSLNWPYGPVHELPPDFEIVGFARKSGLVTFATRGLGSIERLPKAELFMIAPNDAETMKSMVELLTVVSHYHFTETTLDVCSTPLSNCGRSRTLLGQRNGSSSKVVHRRGLSAPYGLSRTSDTEQVLAPRT
jgi:hypothetical protein